MNKTLISLAAGTLALGLAGGPAASANAANPAPPASTSFDAPRTDGAVVEVGHKSGKRFRHGRRFHRSHSHLWKYDYRPAHVCKKRYRWTLTEHGWRNVYVGYWCDHTNNY